MSGAGATITDVLHLIIGPPEHGVVQHAKAIAKACGHPMLRADRPSRISAVPPSEVVHVPFTDRLFGANLDEAIGCFEQLAAAVAATGAELSVTLHDVPHGESPLQERRRALYRQVMARAHGVVVNSRLELALVEDGADGVHSLRLAPLPVGPLVPRPDGPARTNDEQPTVAVLGFVYPDRGYEDVLAALPDQARLLAIGRASDGHDDLIARYRALAPGRWHCTGYLDETELSERLWAADVPVAPNRRVTASGSINTWLAHRRRPLVPDSPYVRELVADRPDALTVYDPDDPTSLRSAVEQALGDPTTTWLAADSAVGPTIGDVVAIYREHFSACAPPAVTRGCDGRSVVPGNRWDLLADAPQPSDAPTVSVVIPYYDAQSQLDRTLAALARQTHPRDRLQIVIADDGSHQPPDLTHADGVAITVVTQDDRGFRAARARNLGAAAADGEVLVFLDADTAPEPAFVDELTRLPHLCPDVVTVGRRRHAELGGLPLDAVLDGSRLDPARLLPEPAWLRDAYGRSADLLDADRRSYRYVISAVLAMHRDLFRDVGGFDDRFVGYGGEDWELAHRCWAAGAVLAHVPAAVAWHDGVDWAGRQAQDAALAKAGPTRAELVKNAETTILAGLLPDPDARGRGPWFPYPAVVARAGAISDVDLLAAARTAFAAGVDVMFWAEHVSGPHAELVLADPRLNLGSPPADVLARAEWLVELDRACDLSTLPRLCAVADRHGEVRSPAVRVTASRVNNRLRRRVPRSAGGAAGGADAGAYLFGRHDRSAPPGFVPTDLSAVLSRC